MIASASSNSSATTGSRRRSSASMFAYWEPWPVYRERHLAAVDAASARSAGQAAGLPESSTRDASSACATRSGPSVKSIAIRSGARSTSLVGGGRIEVASLARLGQLGPERVGEPRLVPRAEHERPPQRRFRLRGRAGSVLGATSTGSAAEERPPLVV